MLSVYVPIHSGALVVSFEPSVRTDRLLSVVIGVRLPAWCVFVCTQKLLLFWLLFGVQRRRQRSLSEVKKSKKNPTSFDHGFELEKLSQNQLSQLLCGACRVSSS